MLLFLKLYGFLKNCDKSEITVGEILCLALKVSVARAWRFFYAYRRYYLKLVTLQKVNFGSHHIVVLKVSQEFY